MVEQSSLPVVHAGEPTVFNHEEFGNIRVVTKDGDPWFVAKDVCDILGIRNMTTSVTGLDDDEKAELGITYSSSNGVTQSRVTVIISESGLYMLIMRSRKPVAKPFQRWITREVIPAIRATGGYIPVKPDETPEQVALRGYEILMRTVEQQRLRIEADAPKVELADAFLSCSEGEIIIRTLGKMWGQAGMTWKGKPFTGQSVYIFLRERGVLSKQKSRDWNIPNQKYISSGLFRLRETVINNGSPFTKTTAHVTPKGIEELTRRAKGWLAKYDGGDAAVV